MFQKGRLKITVSKIFKVCSVFLVQIDVHCSVMLDCCSSSHTSLKKPLAPVCSLVTVENRHVCVLCLEHFYTVCRVCTEHVSVGSGTVYAVYAVSVS